MKDKVFETVRCDVQTYVRGKIVECGWQKTLSVGKPTIIAGYPHIVAVVKDDKHLSRILNAHKFIHVREAHRDDK